MTARPYLVISISVYEDDLASLDACVRRLRDAGVTAATRSSVIRAALDLEDDDEILASRVSALLADRSTRTRTAEPRTKPRKPTTRSHTCSECWSAGHNKLTCPDRRSA